MKTTKEKWIKRIDNLLLYLVIFFVTIMLIAQSLLVKEGTRLYLSKVDKMEGEDLTATMPLYADLPLKITEEATVIKNYQNLLRRSKIIVIKMNKNMDNPNVFLLVNGKKDHQFNNGESKITVYDGDYVEIDGTSLTSPVTFLIRVPDKGLLSPQDGLLVEGEKKVFPIGKIKFKRE